MEESITRGFLTNKEVADILMVTPVTVINMLTKMQLRGKKQEL